MGFELFLLPFLPTTVRLKPGLSESALKIPDYPQIDWS